VRESTSRELEKRISGNEREGDGQAQRVFMSENGDRGGDEYLDESLRLGLITSLIFFILNIHDGPGRPL